MSEPEPRARPVPLREAKVFGFDQAPDVPCDGMRGYLLQEGVVRINLVHHSVIPGTHDPAAKVTGRLICSIPALLRLHESLGRMIDDMEHDGLVQRIDTSADQLSAPRQGDGE